MASSQPKRTAEAGGDVASNIKKPKKSNGDEVASKAKPSQTELQKSILESDAELRKIFLQFLKEKPESIDRKQFVKDFWADRQHLLRAHAIERQQDRGRYNVLSEVKPQVREGSMKIDFTQDQIQDIFRMYPVVRKAHSELIRFDKPPEDRQHFKLELEFWQEFFKSRLCKKLRGLRISEDDPKSPLLDRYLDLSESEITMRLEDQVEQSHVPHFIDLEGNEQNHSQRQGNAPDRTMRPSSIAQMPIIRRLNATSERIASSAESADQSSSSNALAPVASEDDTWEELRLRDLQSDIGETGVELNFDKRHDNDDKARTKNGFVSRSKKSIDSSQHVLAAVCEGNNSWERHTLDLSANIGVGDCDSDESDSENESSTRLHSSGKGKPPKKASEQSLRLATQQIQSLIGSHFDSTFAPAPGRRAGTSDIDTILKSYEWPPEFRDFVNEIVLTHQTTNEFLHYFWSLVLFQSPSMTIELGGLVKAMENNLQRMKSQAEAAETVRKGKLQELRKHAQQIAQRTKRDPGIDSRKAGPSRRQIEAMSESLAKALEKAIVKGKNILKRPPTAP